MREVVLIIKTNNSRLKMETTPGIIQIPILRELCLAFAGVLNFFFELLNNVGFVNVVAAIIIFSFFYQLLFLPFGIRSGIKASKKEKKKEELEKLKEEYQDKITDPVMLAEYNKKSIEITSLYDGKKKKGIGIVLFFVQIFLIMCAFNVITNMSYTSSFLAGLDADSLTNAFSFFGYDLRLSTREAWWPAMWFVFAYVIIFFVPGEISRHIAETKKKKQWLESLSEEERKVVEEVGNKKGGLDIGLNLIKLISPLLIFFIATNVASFVVVFWTINIVWRSVLMFIANKIYKKVLPKIKNKKEVLQ